MNNPRETATVHTPSSTITFTCHFPEENNEEAVGDIVKTMNYCGLFDEIDIT